MNQYSFFETNIDPDSGVATVWLNRPEARNAMHWEFWRDLPLLVAELDQEPAVRVIILLGRGKSFSTGLDIADFFDRFEAVVTSPNADGREELLHLIRLMQSGMNAIATSPKVWIAGIHRHCIGGGLDLIAACDIRLCTQDASFSLREARVAIVADMGSLNRLPAIIGQGNTRLLALSGGDFSANDALRMQLVSEVFPDQATMEKAARELAARIAANPVIAVRGTKHILNYMLDHSVAAGLDYVAVWNAGMLDSTALREMVQAFRARKRA